MARFLATVGSDGAALAFVLGLAQGVLFLLARLPLFADLFEFCQTLMSNCSSFFFSGGWQPFELALCRVAGLALA